MGALAYPRCVWGSCWRHWCVTESRCVLCVCAGARSRVFCSAAQRRVIQMCVCELYALDKSTLSAVRPALCHPSDHPDGDSVCFLHVSRSVGCDIWAALRLWRRKKSGFVCQVMSALSSSPHCLYSSCMLDAQICRWSHQGEANCGDVISGNVKVPKQPCVE